MLREKQSHLHTALVGKKTLLLTKLLNKVIEITASHCCAKYAYQKKSRVCNS